MRRALLDVNVLVALMDADHEAHEVAHAWIDAAQPGGWATCAITQNGLVRVLSQPRYPNAIPAAHALRMLERAVAAPNHVFWPCDLGLADGIAGDRLIGHRQITDAYLLALTVRHDGCLVTLDRTIPRDLVPGAAAEHLVVL
ncbi:MAG: PIN domain-containing protein [Austwickia sp.]|nr:PIN domain-containing protein [Austwickia sp.]MBK8437524.1 PIN domain-containing protein [Austwickia sp.]MBK9102790.1 PIN domain-containing protein [Austwickia sp.]